MGKPAARILDMTAHGGMITGPGCPTVLIGKMPAARITDMHVCPMVTGVVPHAGGPIIGPVPPTVFIGKLPAACVGDMCICAGPPSTILPPGCPTVLIGSAGGGSGGKGGGSAAAAKAGQTLKGKAPQAVEGTEAFPIQVRQELAEAAKYLKPDEIALAVKLIDDELKQGSGGAAREHTGRRFTLADVVEILKAVENEEGYEAARFFASHLDYLALTRMAMGFVTGADPEGNDPNQMPTRFMLLYGADDNKLQEIDDHPDRFDGEDHKIDVANLRKGLRLLGYDAAESGPYDEEVLRAHLHYMGLAAQGISSAALGELYEDEAAEGAATGESGKGILRIRLQIDPALPEAQDDIYTLFSTDASRTYRQSKTVRDDADTANSTLELVFTGLDKDLEYTLEVDPGATGEKKVLLRDRPYGRW